MDLSSRLANLSLAEIASMLNAKQQEVLLASISVAAKFIQQLQAEEQAEQAHQQQQQQQQQLHHHQQQQLQRLQQQQHLHLSRQQQQQPSNLSSTNNHNNNISSNTTVGDLDDDEDELDDQDEDDDHSDDDDSQQFEDHELADQSASSYSHHCHNNSSADPQTLLTIKEFADELKHRRKAIRLSQKGAAQSLRAFTNGEQPCTDAIIYHFENLQLEPDRAMQLIPLLSGWLEWAEKHKFGGKPLPMMSAVSKVPRERKRKVVLFNEKAKQYLEDAFLKNNHPDRYQLDVISSELNIPTRSIRKWFTNRRQRKRFAEKFSPVS